MLRSTLQVCCRLLIHPLQRVLDSAHGSGTFTQIPLKVSVSVRAWARRPRRRTSVSLHDPSHSIKRRVAVMGKHADRKSTRLNSSHVAISYAVFCLKRKNYSDGSRSHAGNSPKP